MATVRAQLQEARDNAQEIENELEKANEAVEILSNQLEEVADYVETEVRRIIEALEKTIIPGRFVHPQHVVRALTDLAKLVEEL